MIERHRHTTDEQGFDYMANTGREEKDRDLVGILGALLILGGIVLLQSLGLLGYGQEYHLPGATLWLHIALAVLLIWATATALYLGLFRARRISSSGWRQVCGILALALAFAWWGTLYSWSYLSW